MRIDQTRHERAVADVEDRTTWRQLHLGNRSHSGDTCIIDDHHRITHHRISSAIEHSLRSYRPLHNALLFFPSSVGRRLG
jgi:hypothetical protein